MRVLLIGGTRFIGPRVVMELVAQGHEVSVFHRGENEHRDMPPEVDHLHGDLNDPESLKKASQTEPDVVVHMMPMNAEQISLAMKTFVGRAGRMISISSMDVYLAYDIFRGKEDDPPLPVPLTEEAPLRRARFPYREYAPDENHMMYGYDKIPVEEKTMSSTELPGTVLRLPAVHGPDDGQHRFHAYVKRMIDKRPFILLDERAKDWRWTRSFVGDTAHAIALAATMQDAKGRIYNVGEESAISDLGWLPLLAEVTHWKGDLILRPPHRLPEKLRAPDSRFDQHLEVDTTKVRMELGFTETITREAGLARTVEWEASTPPEAYDSSAFDYSAEDAAL